MLRARKAPGLARLDAFVQSDPNRYLALTKHSSSPVLPVISGKQQPLQPVWQVVDGSLVPLPINLGPSTEQAYLEMYGTGIRSAKNVTVTVGDLSVPVLYHLAAPGYVGEDQVNIGPLPQSLAGKGSVNIVVTADGQAANTVNVTIQ